jgi:pimeloyl-ACP methyl ester carboxylesterase
MHRGRPVSLAGAVGLFLAMIVLVVPATATAKRVKVVSYPVTFSVTNVNRSAVTSVPCPVDGQPYEVRGHLTGPTRAIAKGKAATLYLHGLGLGEWLWNFTAVPAYDYVRKQAARGHVSVSVDRLGYGASGHPPGLASCIGSQADVAHQIVQELRAGSYQVAGAMPKRFKRVALVGHSAAGAIATVEAYSFGDVNAVGIVGFAANNQQFASDQFGYERTPCEAGGEPAGPGLPSGYGLFGRTPADFRAAMFRSAVPKVVNAALPLHLHDPCGDNLSLITTLQLQPIGIKKIKVPVVVVCGSRDALYSVFNCQDQSSRYTRSRRHSVVIVKGAAHALPIERQAGTFRAKLGHWLSRYGF